MNVEWSFSIQSTQSQQGISFGWIIKIIICWRVSEVPCDSITLCTVSIIRTLASFFSRWAALLTYLAASVPLTLALVMSNTFLFFDFSAVFEQISSCFSILSSAKFLPHILQAVRSSLAFGANMDFLAGVEGVWKYYVSCVFLGWNMFCYGNKRLENSRLNRHETGNKSYSIVKHFTFFLGAGEGGTDFLASLTWESDELRELAAAGDM